MTGASAATAADPGRLLAGQRTAASRRGIFAAGSPTSRPDIRFIRPGPERAAPADDGSCSASSNFDRDDGWVNWTTDPPCSGASPPSVLCEVLCANPPTTGVLAQGAPPIGGICRGQLL